MRYRISVIGYFIHRVIPGNWWIHRIDTALRESEDVKLCLLVIIGVTADGSKEWVAISDGLRESTESWLDVLRDLKERGLVLGPRLAVGDAALGFWNVLEQVDPETTAQRCWFHELGNVLAALPKSLHAKAKADLQAIWMAPTRQEAVRALERFRARYGAKYPKAVEKLEKGREALLAFFDFPAEHWVHLRTTNPIESSFATVRHRTRQTKNFVSRSTFLGLAFKLAEEAAKTWRRIRAPEKAVDVLAGRRYQDGIAVPDDPQGEGQREAA